jgi:glycosyltransferase involved in cell wall biosynthesis
MVRVRALIPAEAKCEYYTGLRWAEPDFDHLVAQMRYVYENRQSARAVGARAAAYVAKHFTWRHTVERIIARLENL